MQIDTQRLAVRLRFLPGLSAVVVPTDGGDVGIVRLVDLGELDRHEWVVAGTYDPDRPDFSPRQLGEDIRVARMEATA